MFLSLHRVQSAIGAMRYTTVDLSTLGIVNPCAAVYRNLSHEQLLAHEKDNNEGAFVTNGAFAVDTGKFTGRSPMDKYIVKQEPSSTNIWWGDVNRAMSTNTFNKLYEKVVTHYSSVPRIYVYDGFCGAHKESQKHIRVITEFAWQQHFVTNMFISNCPWKTLCSKPDFTIINACKVTNSSYKEDGLNSDVFISFNIEKNVAIIGGTYYAGEMKKGIFSMMNYWLPLQGIMPMHCSANVWDNGCAIYFGLSGTGKTTLSTHPKRALIGDDEHGWDKQGVFNFEGGCYAKTINLSEENEPDIFRAIKANAILENCWITPTNEPDYTNTTKTQNGRVSYPLSHIENYKKDSSGPHPTHCIFLTCDAYGVLPPVAKLSSGTERGIVEPQATFSACFGAAFLPLHPAKYASLLQKKLETHCTDVYLVNTGWSGGAYGVGKRMGINVTRECIDAILDRTIENSTFVKDEIFGLYVPETLGSISPELLQPKFSWTNSEDYTKTAHKLADMFKANYRQFLHPDVPDYSCYGPH